MSEPKEVKEVKDVKEKRYIKCKVINRDKRRGDKMTDIFTNEADGTLIQIQDGATVELSEYAFNNLKDSVGSYYIFEKVDDNSPAKIREIFAPRVDVQPLGDFFYKNKANNKKEEVTTA